MILAALNPTGCSIKTLAESTRLHPSTVRRNIKPLLSAGLVDCDPKTKLVVPLIADLDKALDAWAQWSGAAGNGEFRRFAHQCEREQHRHVMEQLASMGGHQARRRHQAPKTATTKRAQRTTWPVRNPPQDASGPGTPPNTAGGPLGS